MRQALRQRLQTAARSLQQVSGRLHTLSPLATLQRGYAIVRRHPEGVIVRQASEVQIGDTVETWLAAGRLLSEIKAVSALDSLPE